jgi:hypothetical protein
MPGSRPRLTRLERLDYFCVGPGSAPGKPVYNRTVTLRDTWAKEVGVPGRGMRDDRPSAGPAPVADTYRELSAMARRLAMSRISSLVMS